MPLSVCYTHASDTSVFDFGAACYADKSELGQPAFFGLLTVTSEPIINSLAFRSWDLSDTSGFGRGGELGNSRESEA